MDNKKDKKIKTQKKEIPKKEVQKNEKTKKELPKKKKIKIGRILLIALILFIIIFTIKFLINVLTPESKKITSIIATKTEDYYGEDEIITYEIDVRDYELIKIKKTIEYPNYVYAKEEYNAYESKNLYEDANIGLERKKNVLILTMPKEQFLNDILYNIDENVVYIQNSNQEEKINPEEIRTALKIQGYTVK